MIPPVLETAHCLAQEALSDGDWAVDATVGNGHDAVWLAECVGPTGKVFGFDIQKAAVEHAERRLEDRQLFDRVQLLQSGHEAMIEHLPAEASGRVRAVMFNLGYLPGGDKSVTTQTGTTRQALNQACELLAEGGVITIVVYTGHPGGMEEGEMVAAWAAALPQDEWRAVTYGPVNQKNNPPMLYAIERLANSTTR